VQKLYPGKIDFTAGKRLIGNAETIRMIHEGTDPRSIQQSFQDAVGEFLKVRDRHLIYR
jgi:hypothetical protein